MVSEYLEGHKNPEFRNWNTLNCIDFGQNKHLKSGNAPFIIPFFVKHYLIIAGQQLLILKSQILNTKNRNIQK